MITTHYFANKVRLYQSMEMIKIDSDLFQYSMTVFSPQVEEIKHTPLFRLEHHTRMNDFYVLHFDNRLFLEPLVDFMIVRRIAPNGRPFLENLARLQRWWRKRMLAKRAALLLAFSMGFHGRLGASAEVSVVGADLAMLISNFI
jgi:hypothetical protein